MTKTEKAIHELEKTIAVLEERLDNVKETSDSVKDIDCRLAVIEDRVLDWKKSAEEKDRRQWTLILAVFGCLLTLVANIVLTYFRVSK